jgi:1-deoxy-D-xylulose-5-phosphate synthase
MLEKITSPRDLKALNASELEQLASEIREKLVSTVSLNGGHLASNLGVVELSIALHRTFDSPVDKIVWDVGHQTYVHKLLTGRKERFDSLRQYGGLSGFAVPEESDHDAFGTGHAGTSISAALGMAIARDLSREKFHVVAILGDGALTTGMSFEAINHTGHMGTKIIIVLNDNGLSISPSVGSLANLFNLIRMDYRYELAKKEASKALSRLPMGELALETSKKIKKRLQKALLPSAFWEELGLTYIGPVDGHNISDMEAAFRKARDYESKPTVVHILTKKGKGYPPAESNAVVFHGIPSRIIEPVNGSSYSSIFGNTVVQLMRENNRVVAITAAMLEGTGLRKAADEFPDRVFDVGICEQHAVTFAAGLAMQGYIPIVAIYSTFLQRAYDQIIHDVCIQNVPVIFAIDRAGIVGDDGKTHQGAFDLSYLRALPNIIVSAPKDGEELRNLLHTAIEAGVPMSIRYPRGGDEECSNYSASLHTIPIGKAEILRNGNDVALIAIGNTVNAALDASKILAKYGIECSVVNARFVKPLDTEMIVEITEKTGRIFTIEENALEGGFGNAVLQLIARSGLKDASVTCIGLPDEFIEHGSQKLLRSKYGLDTDGIANVVMKRCSGSSEYLQMQVEERTK